MLYVFHVDAGQMTTYDMSLTLQTVASLKAAIEKKTKISSNSLVLLVSGGEVLQSDHMVSSYSAGTDTNPIYMFSKPSVKESLLKQSMCDLSPIAELGAGESRSESRGFDGKSVAELKANVDLCRSMQSNNINTVISCATLAQKFSDLAYEVSRSCEQLVHEQHLQHQGWAAVVANLEDIYNEFCERSRNFKESFKKHRQKKEEYQEQLNTLGAVLESLGKIPILPALQVNAEAHRFSGFDVFEENFEGHLYRVSHPLDNSSENKRCQDFGVEAFKLSEEDVFDQKDASTSKDGAVEQTETEKQIEVSDEGDRFDVFSYDSKEEPSLLHWILAQGNKASLQDILDYCEKGLALIDAEPLKEHEEELCRILTWANMYGLKQIKGIEERLYGLDQLLNDVKKLERDQHDQAASLTQYRDRLNSACDPSVLPTLVQSHWCQLEKLLKGHQTLVDIRRRITKSKDELSYTLKARLGTVLRIENSMSVQDAHAMLSFQCFNRLARYFGIVAQLHRAPAVFVRAAHEVARRRAFSTAHLQWATELAAMLQKIHDEEVSRRQEFNAVFEGHFLNNLFPGMMEMPPPYATQAPVQFDARLPQLAVADVAALSDSFPQLAAHVPTYDMTATLKFFQQRVQIPEQEDKEVNVELGLEGATESEAETGDFEKLTDQIAPKELISTSTTCAPETTAVATVTEDNMDSHKINMEKLQEFLFKLYGLCRTNILYIRDELCNLKMEIDEQKKFFKSKYLELLESWKRSNEEADIRYREQTQRLTFDHELELSDMKAALKEKDDIIDSLKREKENLNVEHQEEIEKLNKEHQVTKELLEKTRQEIASFQTKLEEIEVNKQKEIKELQEKMHMDYKAEIESLRSRFRLVALTNMDRSPSESSLEKIERTDVIEISNHNAIVMQTKENAEVEREEAVKEAVAKCEAEWKQKMESELDAIKAKYEAEKQVTINDVRGRLLSEKDRQLEALREREQALVRECNKYRDTIQQLTDPETNDYDALLKTQFATLENDKALLQQQVAELKKQLEKKADEGEKSREEDVDFRRGRGGWAKWRGHTPLGLAAGALSLSSCLPGHTVLVLWDPAHRNYTVMQESSTMYFVYSDCLPSLDLSIQVDNESERRLYAIATVESKEYCYAKKSSNRYLMPRGSRFYRVRVRPLRPHLPQPACCPPAASTATSSDARSKQDIQKPAEPSRGEVATATLINLESPVAAAPTTGLLETEQFDSIEASDQWHTSKMQMSTASALTDMECSVGRYLGPEPSELTLRAALSGTGPVEVDETGPEGAEGTEAAELAEEAAP
ncbi:RB1-inducible coiled-coil protein 1 isoform X2 [Galleria mellonella]|uniref:RB1-inducible coiled-coil protein 1 isoform X2 n=1 Tax=Galleria mellonella TaxID=7137 RepID=A0A6J1WQ41_GALME|nr:RB1-inducible coiled-coil protein 1 isoform X2 [Galleria mellonella]